MALTDGLVAYYPFDSNADDSVASYDGTVNGASLDTTNKKLGAGCYDFDGSNDNISIAHNSVFNLSSTAFSINLWLKPEVAPGGTLNVRLISKEGVAGSRGWALYWFGAVNKELGIGDPNGSRNTVNAFNTTGSWSMITATYSNSGNMTGFKIYINGSEQTCDNYGTTNLPLQTNTNNIFIGSDRVGGSLYNGLIDEVGIWNRALEPEEITSLYNSGNGLAYPFTTSAKKGILPLHFNV